MKALSLRQPWANAVLYLGKRIENRRWYTTFRGEFLIHAAKGMEDEEYDDAVEFSEDVLGIARSFEIESAFGGGGMPRQLHRGGIVGRARLVSVVAPRRAEFGIGGLEGHYGKELAESGAWRWHMHAQYGFVLADVRALPFIPCRGMPSFFDVPDDVLSQVAA